MFTWVYGSTRKLRAKLSRPSCRRAI